VIGAFLVLMCAAAAPPALPPHAVAALQEAERLRAAKEWDKALDAYARVLAAAPGDAGLRVLLAGDFLRSGAPELKGPAYALLREATEIDADHFAANRVLADWYCARDFFRDAADRYRRALRGKPNDPDTLHNLAVALVKLRQFEEALRVAEESVRWSGGGARFRIGVAMVYADWRKHDKALDVLASIDPAALDGAARTLFYQTRGEARFLAGDAKNAIDDFTTLTRLEPKHAKGFQLLGLHLQRLDRFAEAETAFRRAVVLDPANEAAHFGLGTVCLRLGRNEEGVAALARARELAEKRTQARLRDLREMSAELKERQKRGWTPERGR